jgi:putative nucleotidyltransferase with HDIG domain
LRELEQKALGSYNHSIMVSTMCERACRAIGADALLASVAALYHDIGKVRRPWFFVENQFGIGNPHDELEPSVSAVIIQEHVTDGISMAKSHRLPPEIVDGIATHHGTTVVTYFYRVALQEAADRHEVVDDVHFRYKGRKPTSREMAVLMLADCCEGASRAAAQHNRNLSQAELEVIVRTLIAERIDDGQLEESPLTFRDLAVITESFIETLVGVYHPRIPYPSKDIERGGVVPQESVLTERPEHPAGR